MSKGVLCFASNNLEVDYVKQAVYFAKRVKKHLNLPVTLVTSDVNYVDRLNVRTVFDKIISVDKEKQNQKRFYDGSLHNKLLSFDNASRINAYDLSPYEETIVLDIDYILFNNVFLNCFNQPHNFLIYKDAIDVCHWRKNPEFEYINDNGVPFYWATCFFFRKTNEVQVFFNLMKHLKENWTHYSSVFDLGTPTFRNDHIFSMAIHIMNGYKDSNWAKPMPGRKYFALDRDVIEVLDDDHVILLVEKEKYIGEYTLASLKDTNVHLMNKLSLGGHV